MLLLPTTYIVFFFASLFQDEPSLCLQGNDLALARSRS